MKARGGELKRFASAQVLHSSVRPPAAKAGNGRPLTRRDKVKGASRTTARGNRSESDERGDQAEGGGLRHRGNRRTNATHSHKSDWVNKVFSKRAIYSFGLLRIRFGLDKTFQRGGQLQHLPQRAVRSYRQSTRHRQGLRDWRRPRPEFKNPSRNGPKSHHSLQQLHVDHDIGRDPLQLLADYLPLQARRASQPRLRAE